MYIQLTQSIYNEIKTYLSNQESQAMIELKQRNNLGTIKALKTGESWFFASDASYSEQSIRSSVTNYSKQSGRKFTCRSGHENGVRGIRVFCLL